MKIQVKALLLISAVLIMPVLIHPEAETEKEILKEESVPAAFPSVGIVLNISEAEHGHIAVSVAEPDRYACVIRNGEQDYTYVNLSEGKHDLPLTENGTYEIITAEKLEGQSYRILSEQEIDVILRNPSEVFLKPDIMVDWNESDYLATAAKEIIDGRNTEDAVIEINRWVHDNIVYDTEKKKQMDQGESGLSKNIPDPAKIFRERKGICLDQSSLAAAMLRSSGIPAALVFGDCRGVYHSWLEVYLADGSTMIADPTLNFTGTSEDYIPKYYY